MSNLDQFESIFKAASKERFIYKKFKISNVLLVHDLAAEQAENFLSTTQTYLSQLDSDLQFSVLTEDDFTTVRELLDKIEEHKPDLIVTYRHLCSQAWHWSFGLGEFLDVMTQATRYPVLVVPHPKNSKETEHLFDDTWTTMAITDHLTGDHALVNYAVHFTAPKGNLYLTHVEDDATFERYIETISKIPDIDTETARKGILAQLLKEPKDYIRTCIETLEAEKLDLEIIKIVTTGHRLSEYKKMLDEHKVDLLIINTKDEDQFAMHGMAYPLAVEFRSIPILML